MPDIDLEPDEYREAGVDPDHAAADKHFDKIVLGLLLAFIAAWFRNHL